ncbi:FAD binding domain-containing protein [Paracandidimonas soli]|uniref:FAD binding domain-containing protein n=1 Tax=Paracandidimonas soli TaxID=1917182 RepID=UPI00333EA49F
MKPQKFDYVRAETAQEAVDMLAELGGDARIMAGGQSLMAVLNMRLAQPAVLIDISRTADLKYLRADKTHLSVGAATTQGTLEWSGELPRQLPLLTQVFPFISHFQIRNKGTVCGSVAHADPSAELPLSLALLGGEVVLRNRKRKRTVAAEDFFQGMLMTAKAPDELVEEVRFPLAREDQRFAFTEFSARHGDFAIASVGAMRDGRITRLAVGGVSDRPVVMQWEDLQRGDWEGVLNDLAWDLQAQDDHHASAQFRRHLVRRLGLQILGRISE